MRINAAIDGAQARARLANGELRVVLPRIAERRGAGLHHSDRIARPARMKLLFLGDIVGRPGRDLVRRHVRALAARHHADLVIANGENAAGGAGITRENMLEILSAGVDVITTGNHVWDKRETLEFIGNEPRLLRPANYPEGTPGAGSCVVDGEERRPRRRDQRDGPRVPARDRRSVPRRRARDRARARRRRAGHLRGHARGDDVGEDRAVAITWMAGWPR